MTEHCEVQCLNKCEKCEFESAEEDCMNTHLVNQHGIKSFECKNCDYSTSEATALLEHLNNHTDVKSYECEEGESNFEAECSRDLVIHFLNIHNLPSISLKYELCDFVAFDEKLLNVHKVNSHED